MFRICKIENTHMHTSSENTRDFSSLSFVIWKLKCTKGPIQFRFFFVYNSFPSIAKFFILFKSCNMMGLVSLFLESNSFWMLCVFMCELKVDLYALNASLRTILFVFFSHLFVQFGFATIFFPLVFSYVRAACCLCVYTFYKIASLAFVRCHFIS